MQKSHPMRIVRNRRKSHPLRSARWVLKPVVGVISWVAREVPSAPLQAAFTVAIGGHGGRGRWRRGRPARATPLPASPLPGGRSWSCGAGGGRVESGWRRSQQAPHAFGRARGLRPARRHSFPPPVDPAQRAPRPREIVRRRLVEGREVGLRSVPRRLDDGTPRVVAALGGGPNPAAVGPPGRRRRRAPPWPRDRRDRACWRR